MAKRRTITTLLAVKDREVEMVRKRNGSGRAREEVAGSRVGELLEEGGEGALTGLCPGLECLPNRLWQAGLERGRVKKENRKNDSK